MFLGGFLLFLIIITMAFWLLIFLAGFALPYSLTVWVMHKLNPKKAEKSSDNES